MLRTQVPAGLANPNVVDQRGEEEEVAEDVVAGAGVEIQRREGQMVGIEQRGQRAGFPRAGQPSGQPVEQEQIGAHGGVAQDAERGEVQTEPVQRKLVQQRAEGPECGRKAPKDQVVPHERGVGADHGPVHVHQVVLREVGAESPTCETEEVKANEQRRRHEDDSTHAGSVYYRL